MNPSLIRGRGGSGGSNLYSGHNSSGISEEGAERVAGNQVGSMIGRPVRR
jgi:hypothetical protein